MNETILKILALRDKIAAGGGKNIESKRNIKIRKAKKGNDTTRIC